MTICLFDIDGTLLASGGAGKAALELAFTEIFGIALRVQIPYSGRTDRAIARDLLGQHGIEHTLENWEKLQTGYLARLPASLNRHNGRVLPGILTLLEALQRRGNVTLGLLTGNVRAGARVKLGHFGLYEHFAFGGFGDLHFDRDDVAREALAAARTHVGTSVTPERIWVIGDTPLDVKCARAIGAKVVAVATGVHTVEQLIDARPELTLGDFSDPSAFLALLP
ncbi:MAG: haloacid dehalogenase-like hydrolase [Planctomycetes bacterium]|nr:haloacid dehalogenase-like hydrolase [Planctomycetota bacterium]